MQNRFLKNKWINVWIFLFIFVVAIILRFFRLESGVPILNRDEAALAYNAKLLIDSGVDEWGNSWPLQFRSFGDYKLPGYIFSLVPFFIIFGEHDWVVRSVSATSGLVIIVILSFFSRDLVDNRLEKLKLFFVTLLISATSPFAIFYSRMAWEANLSLAFFLSSLLLLYKSKKDRRYHVLSLFFYFLAVFTYNTPLLLFPLLLLLMLYYFWPIQKKNFITIFSFFFIFVLALATQFSIADQKGNITIFSDPTTIAEYPQYRAQIPEPFRSLLGSKYVYWGTLIARNYIHTWSPNFLAFRGGSHPWHTIPGFGHLNSFVLVLGYFGVILLLFEMYQIHTKPKTKSTSQSQTIKFKVITVTLLIVSPLPSVITIDAPHATRSLLFFTMFILVASYAFIKICNLLLTQFSLRFYRLFALIFIICSLHAINYLNTYINVWPKYFPRELRIGLPKTLDEVSSGTVPVAIIDTEGYDYILVAWYKKIPGEVFLNTIQRHLPDQAGLSYGFKVKNYTFYKNSEDTKDDQEMLYQVDSTHWQKKTL